MPLFIDGQTHQIGSFGLDQFSKGDISSAWRTYGDEKITFSKRGSELKSILYKKKYQLEEARNLITTKMNALQAEMGESKSGSREGHVDNISNNMEYELPHDSVKQLSEEDKALHSAYNDLTYQLRKVDQDIRTVDTLVGNLEDEKEYTINLMQLESIAKSDLAYAFNDYGEGGKSPISFDKKGSEIKSMLNEKVSSYQVKMTDLRTRMASIAAQLKEKGYEPNNTPMEYDETPRYNWYSAVKKDSNEPSGEVPQECRTMMEQYNEMAYQVDGMNRDIKAANILIQNLDDNKTYKLGVRHIAAMQKGEDMEELSKASKAAQKKVEKVMREFKEGKLKSGSGEAVTDRKQAIAIAMSEAGISKDEMKKFSEDGYVPGEARRENIDMKKAMDDAFKHLGVDSLDQAMDQLEKGGNKTEFSTKERKKLADKGAAMPDGSFPIRNKQDLKDAIKSVGRAKDPSAAKSHIKKRAKALGLTDLLPDNWE